MADLKHILRIHDTKANLLASLKDTQMGWATDTNEVVWREGLNYYLTRPQVEVIGGDEFAAGGKTRFLEVFNVVGDGSNKVGYLGYDPADATRLWLSTDANKDFHLDAGTGSVKVTSDTSTDAVKYLALDSNGFLTESIIGKIYVSDGIELKDALEGTDTKRIVNTVPVEIGDETITLGGNHLVEGADLVVREDITFNNNSVRFLCDTSFSPSGPPPPTVNALGSSDLYFRNVTLTASLTSYTGTGDCFYEYASNTFGGATQDYWDNSVNGKIITSDSTQTGLTGDKTSSGDWIFNLVTSTLGRFIGTSSKVKIETTSGAGIEFDTSTGGFSPKNGAGATTTADLGTPAYPWRNLRLSNLADIAGKLEVGGDAELSQKIDLTSYTNSTPVNGDIWFDGTNLKGHEGGATSNLIGGGGGSTKLKYQATTNIANISGGTALNGSYFATKVIPEADIDVDQLEYYVTSASSGKTIYCGIYSEDGTTLLGEASGNANAVGEQMTGSISGGPIALTGGTSYWFAVLEGSGSPNLGSKAAYSHANLNRSAFASLSPTGMPASIAGGTASTTSFFIGAKA